MIPTITAFSLRADHRMTIVPASRTRQWMEHSGRFAHRCLPLTMANSAGWDIILDADYLAEWSGNTGYQGLTVRRLDGQQAFAESKFGNGIVTFNLPWVFGTSPGVDLWVRGPANLDNASIQPLEGIVETWWNPFTFTMNWKFVTPGKFLFARGMAFCRIVPYPHDYLDRFRCETTSLQNHPERQRQFRTWEASRRHYNTLLRSDPKLFNNWQRHYHQGINFTVDNTPIAEHRHAWGLQPFVPVEKSSLEFVGEPKRTLAEQLQPLLEERRHPDELLALLNADPHLADRGNQLLTVEALLSAITTLLYR